METDTDDCTGQVIRNSEPPSLDAIESAIPSLTGDVLQVPPAYSAKSVNGTRAYDAARQGAPLQLEPVTVKVHDWLIRAARAGEIDVTITCGSGTYIRALARDLGRATGSAAHLASLRRTRSGKFDVRDAVTVDRIRESAPPLRQLTVVASSV